MSYTSMTIKEITAIYNTHSDHPIKKFETKADAIRRTEEIILQKKKIKMECGSEILLLTGPKVKKMSLTKKCCQLIVAGKSNEEIWKILCIEYGFRTDDKRKSYPGWNRSMLVRTGQMVSV